jgi:hypothetical protein
LDHNIPQSEVRLLRAWRIHCRQVGYEVGRPEWDDAQEIIRYLRESRRLTFFTRDVGFFRRRLCRKRYSIVILTGLAAKAPNGSGASYDIGSFVRKHSVLETL